VEDTLVRFLTSVTVLAIYFLILFLVVRAAMVSALRRAGPDLRHTNEILATQANLTARLARHLTPPADPAPIAAPAYPPGFDLPFR
jgi:hypothetical protein